MAKLVFHDLLTAEFKMSQFLFLLEASKLGEEELAVVKQERVNFLSKKYSSSGGSSVLFLEMDKVIF